MQEISKVDLLVHPGYLATIAQNSSVNMKKRKLYERYVKRAIEVVQDEQRILIVLTSDSPFSHKKEDQTNTDQASQDLYTTRNSIEELLGDRFIHVPGYMLAETRQQADDTERDKVFEAMEAILAEKGFTISRLANVLAYGETTSSCVPKVAANFQYHFLEMDHPVDVNLRLTNVAVRNSESELAELERMQQDIEPFYIQRFADQFDPGLIRVVSDY